MADGSNYRNLITRFASSGQWERTLETAREWLSLEPENTDAHYAAGRALVILDRHTEAERHLMRVLVASPDHSPTHRLMAEIYFTAGRFKAADESIRKAISLNPRDAGAWFELAQMCESRNDLASAKEFAAKALELSPRNPKIMNFLNLCEPWDRSKIHEKLERYHKVLELDPTNAVTHDHIGFCHLHYTGSYEVAEESFRRALFFDPSNKNARSNLFETLKNRDPIYRGLHAPKDILLKVSPPFPNNPRGRDASILCLVAILLYGLTVPYVLFASLFIGLGFWCVLFWPLVKAYEYLTIGDIHSKAGEVGAKRGGVLGYRRLPLRVRLAIFAACLAGFWGGTAVLLLEKYAPSIKHTWNILRAHPLRSGIIAYAFTLFFCLVLYLLVTLHRKIQERRTESLTRRRSEIFATVSTSPEVKAPCPAA